MFVLSAGSDPFGAFQRFAAEMGYKDKILAISLGQGQGPVAAKLIEQGTANGHWVFLQVIQTLPSTLLNKNYFRTAIWPHHGC